MFMLYNLVTSLIGEVPVEFEFIYGLVTIVACVFGVLLIFTPLILILKMVKS